MRSREVKLTLSSISLSPTSLSFSLKDRRSCSVHKLNTLAIDSSWYLRSTVTDCESFHSNSTMYLAVLSLIKQYLISNTSWLLKDKISSSYTMLLLIFINDYGAPPCTLCVLTPAPNSACDLVVLHLLLTSPSLPLHLPKTSYWKGARS